MTKVIEINGFSWSGPASTHAVQSAVRALEAGEVLYLPDLRFDVADGGEIDGHVFRGDLGGDDRRRAAVAASSTPAPAAATRSGR